MGVRGGVAGVAGAVRAAVIDSRDWLLARLQFAVEHRGEAQVLATHLGELNGARCVVLVRAGDAWRAEGVTGIDVAFGTTLTREQDLAGWLQAKTGASWSVREVTYGRRVVAQLALDVVARHDETASACVLASSFLAAISTRRPRGELSPTLRIAGVVHDLRQPLAVMRLSLDLVEATQETAHLERCRRVVGHMQRIVDDLLGASGERPPVAVELAPLVASVVGDLDHTARRSNVTLKTVAQAQPILAGDVTALTRALSNVVQNAIDHSPPAAEVTVTVGEAAGGAFVEVRDQGEGVAPELRERVFEPFYTTRPSGNGIGLAVTRSIIEAHGGRIRFVDGAGGVLCINLPVVRRV